MLIKRLFARYIDNISILVLSILIGVITLDLGKSINTRNSVSNLPAIAFILSFVILYTFNFVIFTKRSGQSFGKKLLKIKLVNDNNKDLKFTTVFFRELVLQTISIASVLGFILLLVPYFSTEHRLLHDFIFKTNVVKKN